MAEGIIPMLDDVLQSLPKDSPEAAKLLAVIHMLMDATELRMNEFSRIQNELTDERSKREEAERRLRQCTEELEKLRNQL